jgi:hypothetical protein
MISDQVILSEIRNNWTGVESLRTRLQVSAFASKGLGGSGVFPFVLLNAAHNLPFLHAYSVLNEVLIQLVKENRFSCKSIFLGALLEKSKNALPWINFSLVKTGADRRNDLAHRGQLLERSDCWSLIDHIKLELLNWKVLE